MDERQTMHAMMLDDAYCVERVLADGAYGVTEMVSLDGAGRSCARRCRRGWRGGDCGPHTRRMRFVAAPRVEATYELPTCSWSFTTTWTA